MNSKDMYSINKTTSQFPKAFDSMKKPRLNIPDLNVELEKDQSMFYSFDTSVQPPPLSTTSCFITESRNTDPYMLRSSMYVLPCSTSIAESLNIPFGVVLTPFTNRANIIECSSSLALRCFQCLSYVNNFTKFEKTFFFCNICKVKNPLNPNVDLDPIIFKHPTLEYVSTSIPALTNTSVENAIDSAFFKRRVFNIPLFVFVIDVTSPMLLQNTISSIVDVLMDETFRFLFKKLAIIKVSNKITILKRNANVISDLDVINEATLPFLPPDVFFDSEDLDLLVEYLNNMKYVQASCNLDKVFDVLVSLSTYGIGTKTAIFTQSPSKMDLEGYAQKFIDTSNSLSLFTNVETGVEKLAIITMGNVYRYVPDQLYKIKSDLHNLCTTKSAFGVHMEVRTSDAIRRNAIYANTIVENLSFAELAQMDSNSSISYSFYIDENTSTKENLYIQFSVDYFSHDGTFRTLVMNTEFRNSDKINDIIGGLSFDTLFCCFAKFISSDIKNAVTHSKLTEEMICKFLKYYRKNCCKEISSTQFVLPESTKLLPLLYQSLIKNKSFSTSLNELEFKRVMNFTVEQNLRYFYPRLFTLTDYYMEQDLTKLKCLRLSSTSLESSEIYVLENSQKIYLYIGKDVDDSLKNALFHNEEENKILIKMVDEICSNYGYELPVIVVEENKGGNEVDFIGYMVEDTLNGVPNYHDYICELHFKVQRY